MRGVKERIGAELRFSRSIMLNLNGEVDDIGDKTLQFHGRDRDVTD